MYDPWNTLGTLIVWSYTSAVFLFYLWIAWKNAHQPRYAYANGERGQGLVEYALILVLVAVIVIAILLVLGPSIKNIF
jgi:pilus assembly protein Flp/PilA